MSLAPDCKNYITPSFILTFSKHKFCKLHPNCRNDCKDFEPKENIKEESKNDKR